MSEYRITETRGALAGNASERLPYQFDRQARQHPISAPMSVARRCLVVGEFTAVILAAILAKWIYLDWMLASYPDAWPYVAASAGLAVAVCVTHKQMGLYDDESLIGPALNLGKLLGGLAIAFLVLLGLLYAVKLSEAVSRGWIATWFIAVAVVLVPLRAYVIHLIGRGLASGMLKRRIAVVGSAQFAGDLAGRITETEGLSYQIDVYGLHPAAAADPRVAGALGDLETALLNEQYDQVFVAIPAAESENIQKVVRTLGCYATELMLITDLTAPLITTTGARQIGGVRADIVHLLPGSEHSWFLKRMLDVILASIALVLLLPVLLLVAVAVRLDSPGPALFRQRRSGQNGSTFRIYKFRTMVQADEGDNVVQAIRNDRRVTRLGRILRATSIDELPQLINVLLGHMSLVGPRPHAVSHDLQFEQQFDLFSRRRRVKPGITGWAQINGYRGETRTSADVQRRMEYDLYYINNWSIWLDIEIMARTLLVVFRGAY